MNPRLAIIAVALTLGRCAVEAGNPGGTGKTEPKKGMLTLRFARQLDVRDQSLSLNLSSLDLVEGENDESVVASLTPTVGSIDLFAPAEADSEVVAGTYEVPVGTYDRIVVRLSATDPVTYRDEGGTSRSVELESPSFQVEEPFAVSEGGTTDLILTLDPYRSLSDPGSPSRPMRFQPRGHMQGRGRDAAYDGTTKVSGAVWVCAYAYGAYLAPPPSRQRPSPGEKGRPPMPPPGPRLEQRRIFSTKDEIVRDATRLCENAFAVAPVTNGAYRLRHAVPASYALRFFKADGSFEDAPDDVTLAAPPLPPGGKGLKSRP